MPIKSDPTTWTDPRTPAGALCACPPDAAQAAATVFPCSVVLDMARKNPVVVQDFPTHWGFVANRVYFAMIREAQRVVDSGIASPEDVNQLMADCFNWPVGPFAMLKGAESGWKD